MADPRANDLNYSPDKLRAIARDAASRYGLDFNILDKQFMQESGYKAFDSSGNPLKTGILDKNGNPASDATGVAQITSDTAKEWKVDPTDPIASIYAAAQNIKKYQDYFSNTYHVKDEIAQKLAVAAYHDGLGGVQKAIADNGGLLGIRGVADEGKGLTTEGQKYLKQIFDPNYNPSQSVSASDYAAQAKKALGIKDTTTSGPSTPSSNSDLPPNMQDYYVKNADGTTSLDPTYFDSYSKWAAAQEAIQRTKLNPQGQYYDDVIKELTAQINAGTLSVSKATNALTSQIDVYKTIATEAPKLAEYAVPNGAKYVPQWEPGGWFSSLPGLKPLEANTMPVDLFGQGINLARQGAAINDIPTPSNSSVQGALPPIPGAPPSGTPATPPTSGNDMFSAALARIQSQAQTAADPMLVAQQQGA